MNNVKFIRGDKVEIVRVTQSKNAVEVVPRRFRNPTLAEANRAMLRAGFTRKNK